MPVRGRATDRAKVLRLCERCRSEVPRPRVLCRCGGRIVEYHPRDVAASSSEQQAPQIGWQDVGKFIGARVTGGSALGTFVGGLVGKVLDGGVVTMTPVIEPPVVNVVGIDKKALVPIKEKIGRVASRAITVGGSSIRSKRDSKQKKDVR